MKDHKQRVIDEHKDLLSRTYKLMLFAVSSEFMEVEPGHRDLLILQKDIMLQYLDILEQRLDLWEVEYKKMPRL